MLYGLEFIASCAYVGYVGQRPASSSCTGEQESLRLRSLGSGSWPWLLLAVAPAAAVQPESGRPAARGEYCSPSHRSPADIRSGRLFSPSVPPLRSSHQQQWPVLSPQSPVLSPQSSVASPQSPPVLPGTAPGPQLATHGRLAGTGEGRGHRSLRRASREKPPTERVSSSFSV